MKDAPIVMTKTLKRKLNKILKYAIDSEMESYLECIGDKGYKSHPLVTTVQVVRALSNKPPKCVYCHSKPPFTEDGMFCRRCTEDEIGLCLDDNGKYLL